MRSTTERARFAALALLAAVAGTAAVGLAVLAHAGAHVCGHNVAHLHQHATAIAGMAAGTAPADGGDAEGLCPIVVYASAVAAALCLLAVLALLRSRLGLPAVITAAARLVARIRFGPLTALVGLAGALPLAGILMTDGVPEGPVALLAIAALLAGALVTAGALAALARVVLSAAERLAGAIIAAFRLLAPGTRRRGRVMPVRSSFRPASASGVAARRALPRSARRFDRAATALPYAPPEPHFMHRVRTALVAFACAASIIAAGTPARADIAGTVRGTLTRPDHRPVPHASVTLSGDRITQIAVTADDGKFAFARVPFGHYTVRATTPDGSAAASVDVASDAVVDVALVAMPVIGRTGATTTSVRGTPVSENAYGARRLAALPRNDRLDAIIEQVPGVVRFSYDEPVAHGFHGLSYELDGAPLPQSTSSNFAQLIDPRNAQAVEIFTGAFPAEFGGSRQGAVVNVVSGGTEAGTGRAGGALTLGGGELGTAELRLVQQFNAGRAQISLALNGQRSGRGLDAPSRAAQHDASSTSDQFLRIALPMGERDLLAADLSNQFAAFQIPISTTFSPQSPYVAVPGTDDVQREYDRFASLSFTHTSKDGNGFVRVVPWMRWNRVAYDGDLARDILANLVRDDGTLSPQNGLRQDRIATYAGLRASAFRVSDRHALKLGVDVQQQNLRSSVFIGIPGSPDFVDNTAAKATQTGAYVQDKWSPTRTLAINAGLRYDHSTGYTGGAQLSPRLEINDEIGRGTVLHAYAGRLYAAPALEDVRRDAVVTQTSPTSAPVYDLQPERDTYLELGLARTFRPGLRGYVNLFDRTAVNVLDTTQLANTPLFAVFNNAVGRDRGIELRLDGSSPRADAGVSLTFQRAEAGGVSGGTFLFAPDAATDLTLQPEDHDQRWAGNAFYTRHFGGGLRAFATLQAEYGTGFPTAFESGEGRLPAHWVVDASFGRTADRTSRGLGYAVSLENLFDRRFLIKVNNGFNTTQWNAPRRIVVRVTAPW